MKLTQLTNVAQHATSNTGRCTQNARATHDLTSRATTFDGPSRARCTLNTARCMMQEAPAYDARALQPATINLHHATYNLQPSTCMTQHAGRNLHPDCMNSCCRTIPYMRAHMHARVCAYAKRYVHTQRTRARTNAHEPTRMIDVRGTMYASCMQNAQRTVCAARARTQHAARSTQHSACSM
jgi:hypothetical protein